MYDAKYNELKALVEGMATDIEKSNNNVKAAKVRVRQYCQQIKAHCTEMRAALQEPTTPTVQQ